MEINCVLERLSIIAAKNPSITRMWVFGSRHEGSYNQNSDLDIAIKVKWVSGFGFCGSSLAIWSAAHETFKEEMQRSCPYKLDLQWYGSQDETPNIHSYIDKSSKLIYSKDTDIEL